jgi:hypothetical protein
MRVTAWLPPDASSVVPGREVQDGPMAPAPEDLVCTTCGATVLANANATANPHGHAAGDRDRDALAGVPARDRADADADADAVALARLTWTRGTDRGEVVWTCDRCSRAHLRSIEAKLDQAWW